ncbi:MAG TPA: hypothetical protein EYQ35_10750, partial [candidate division UBP10 bacterium]|nr:hypothetical protein [Candidatus Binatota bacterium]
MSFRAVFAAGLTAALFVLVTAMQAPAAGCGDPAPPPNGDGNVTAADALYCLQMAVGSQTTDLTTCDADDGGTATAADALRVLQNAVGQAVTLTCPGGGSASGLACTSAEFFPLGDSELDSGTTGLGHNATLVEGFSLTFDTPKACVGGATPGDACSLDADCGGGTCDVTCNCDGTEDCEIRGPALQGRCLTTLVPCDSGSECVSGQCERFFGSPLPLSSGGVPVCVTTYFSDDIVGTANPSTGQGEATASLRSRVHLGLTSDQPCPRCGHLNDNPEVGDNFLCDGGPHDGLACTVGGFSPKFGGVSFDCPPDVTSNVSGQGLAIIFPRVTTRTDSQTAEISCTPPYNHGGFFSGKCTHDPLNASINCTTDTECQALHPKSTCGFNCHCGFCATASAPQGDPDQPCFNDGQCLEVGSSCIQGTGSVPANAAQVSPNACGVGFCGNDVTEECHDKTQGTCSDRTYLSCTNDSSCIAQGAGTCVIVQKPCFEGTITREGVASPVGSHCM